MRRFVMALALWAGVSTASASERRVALLVGHPLGGEELEPLRYTALDLDRMREVLELLGGFARNDVLVSLGESVDTVTSRFEEVRGRVARAKTAEAASTLFLFYYTGHARDGALRLGESEMALVELKRLVESTGADVRVALLDSCRTGAITRLKGVSKGEPISLSVEDAASQSGQVLITAASENEDAQESDDIQGSFFTHFLTSGLRGAADANNDGAVTLSEAYAFAYANTVERTVGTRGGIQHPSYRFDLRGKGDVVLARSTQRVSTVGFPAGLSGHFVIFDRGRRAVIAEIDKHAGAPEHVAVSPGSYVVKKREREYLRLQKIDVEPEQVAWVDLAAMQRVEFADDYAKGVVVRADDIRRGRLGVRLSALAGGLFFLSAPVRDDYFPALGAGYATLELDNLVARNLALRVDVGAGLSPRTRLTLDEPGLGSVQATVQVSAFTGGVTLAARLGRSQPWSAEAGVRLGFINVQRRFLDVNAEPQGFATLTPGLHAGASLALGRLVSAGVLARLHYMYFNFDKVTGPRSLLYLDGGLVFTVVLR